MSPSMPNLSCDTGFPTAFRYGAQQHNGPAPNAIYNDTSRKDPREVSSTRRHHRNGFRGSDDYTKRMIDSIINVENNAVRVKTEDLGNSAPWAYNETRSQSITKESIPPIRSNATSHLTGPSKPSLRSIAGRRGSGELTLPNRGRPDLSNSIQDLFLSRNARLPKSFLPGRHHNDPLWSPRPCCDHKDKMTSSSSAAALRVCHAADDPMLWENLSRKDRLLRVMPELAHGVPCVLSEWRVYA